MSDDAAAEGGDNRKHKRFSVEVEATVRTSTGIAVQAKTRDVSQTGICLISQEPVPPNDLLNVDLVLAFGDNAYSEPLALDARVVWCTKIGDAYQIGAMFEEVSEDQDNFLEMFLQFLDGTLAPKGVEGYGGNGDDDDAPPDEIEKDNPFGG